MTEYGRSLIIRARQRARGGRLLGFDPNLAPSIEEWGVDRLHMQVRGVWTSTQSGAALFENRLSVPETNWFSVPRNWYNTLSTYVKKRARTTLGTLRATINSVNQRNGSLNVELIGNPTRTLAHLIARFGEQNDFAEHIATISAIEFFEMASDEVRDPSAPVECSLDQSDNWIRDPLVARTRLGQDLFANFLPIYVRQVQAIVTLLLMGDEDTEVVTIADIILRAGQSRITVRWGEASFPQIECYFERYHSRALNAVRYGSFALLAGDHSVGVRRYPSDLDLERDNDSFRVAIPLTDIRKLVVYAKTPERIRFEVRRDGKGDYREIATALHPEARLIEICMDERCRAQNAVDWRIIGILFGGPDEANFGDLGHLVSNVLACFPNDASAGSNALMRVLEDGAISASEAEPAAIKRLQQMGILQRTAIRRHDTTGRSVRYSLREPYHDLHQIMTGALRPRRP